jgi:hypothetical protein
MSDDPELALILKIIWRLIVVTFAFCAAIIAAGLVLGITISHDILLALSYDYPPGVEHQALRGFFLVLAFAGISFVPWAIGTIIAELLQFRSVFYHLGLGALCGAAATILHPMSDPRMLQVAIATGLVAGGVYWIIAGRRAGDWWPRHVPQLYRARSGQMPPPPPPPLV